MAQAPKLLRRGSQEEQSAGLPGEGFYGDIVGTWLLLNPFEMVSLVDDNEVPVCADGLGEPVRLLHEEVQ